LYFFNIRSRFCLEDWDLVIPTIKDYSDKGPLDFAVPMVSFCDIPLSQIRKHVRYYGHYAIGLTKEWGIENNICPVLYTHNKSELSHRIKTLFIKAIEQKHFKEKYFRDNFESWIKFSYFVKPYEGLLWRGDNYLNEKIIFYDEREWRFYPDIPIWDQKGVEEVHSFLNKEAFIEDDKRQKANKVIEKFKLSFEPKNIKYIIVDKEDEIYDMVNKVTQLKSDYNYKDVQVLATRIISLEHIFEDF
jgi:hypothetical protein